MSVEKRGTQWRVRWRDEGGRERSRVIGRKSDAIAADAEIKRLKRLGDLDLIQSELTVAQAAGLWMTQQARPTLSLKSRTTYAGLWNKHLNPIVGGLRLSALKTADLDALIGALQTKELAPLTVQKILSVLRSILRFSIQRGYLRRNPMDGLRMPAATAKRRGRALMPEQVEAIRMELNSRGALIVSLMAYAGLRPMELRGLEWEDVTNSVIHVRSDVAKTGVSRTISLETVLQSELREWRLASPTGPWLLPSALHARSPWSRKGWVAWQSKTFAAATERAKLAGVIPYDLRHTFVSLMVQAGNSVYEVARQAGHSPKQTLDTYGHLFEGYDPTERIDLEAEVAEARVR